MQRSVSFDCVRFIPVVNTPISFLGFLVVSRYTIFKNHITLADYEIHDGANLELYYQ